jgi:hypothetical protein
MKYFKKSEDGLTYREQCLLNAIEDALDNYRSGLVKKDGFVDRVLELFEFYLTLGEDENEKA